MNRTKNGIEFFLGVSEIVGRLDDDDRNVPWRGVDIVLDGHRSVQ